MLKEPRIAGGAHVLYHRTASAGSRLQPSDVSEDLIAAARVVHLTGITPALSASARDTVWHVVRLADAKGVPLSFDVNYRKRLWDTAIAAAELSALAAEAAIVFAGEDELPLITGGERGPDAARELARSGPASRRFTSDKCAEIVIKCGSRGASVFTTDGTVHEQAAVPVTAVDPVGAGDAFAVGYLAGFLSGQEPGARLRLGSATAPSPPANLRPRAWRPLPERGARHRAQPMRTIAASPCQLAVTFPPRPAGTRTFKDRAAAPRQPRGTR